ncbi:hotdog fold domain-containing protein [Dyella humicola]|uniref:hotdog fold domain-containing protein n=1 Tax=Dyella humicola TaxID=2992126 RepID=UPI002250E4FA|nr:hotdog fold domain-containing protein [Dyella humicola]
MSRVLSLYRRLASLPGGRWIFSRLICFKAPYFATIAPYFMALEPGRCEVRIRDRRRVHNHIGTVHAIALCNVAELSAGVMTDVTIPPSMRWIPKGMTVEYVAKAVGTMHALAKPESAAVESTNGYAWPVTVNVRNDAGEEVFRARIDMWVSARSRH